MLPKDGSVPEVEGGGGVGALGGRGEDAAGSTVPEGASTWVGFGGEMAC